MTSPKLSNVSKKAPKETNESYLAMTSPKQSVNKISYQATSQHMDVAESSQDAGEQGSKRKEFRKDGTMQWEEYQILTHKADDDSQ